ncbi:hypothetical protein B0H11DRAFT_1918274 [Mycena galericulata]|nr:hypothetical protein B0H11DRAFT_1918274 [Mycena galericulata]
MVRKPHSRRHNISTLTPNPDVPLEIRTHIHTLCEKTKPAILDQNQTLEDLTQTTTALFTEIWKSAPALNLDGIRGARKPCDGEKVHLMGPTRTPGFGFGIAASVALLAGEYIYELMGLLSVDGNAVHTRLSEIRAADKTKWWESNSVVGRAALERPVFFGPVLVAESGSGHAAGIHEKSAPKVSTAPPYSPVIKGVIQRKQALKDPTRICWVACPSKWTPSAYGRSTERDFNPVGLLRLFRPLESTPMYSLHSPYLFEAFYIVAIARWPNDSGDVKNVENRFRGRQTLPGSN